MDVLERNYHEKTQKSTENEVWKNVSARFRWEAWKQKKKQQKEKEEEEEEYIKIMFQFLEYLWTVFCI